MTGMGRLLRRRLIAGLIVIAPLGVTAYVLYLLFTTVDGILGRSVYEAIGFPIPGLGLVLLLALLLAVGWAAEATVGSQLVEWWHDFLDRIPVVSRLYGATRRIVGSVFGGEEKRFFRDVVLFEYPSPGQWTLGFQTGKAPRALDDRVEDGVTIFLPTSPNPVTGFLIIVPEKRVVRLGVTVEEGFTYILSAGAVPPTGRRSEPRPPSRAQRVPTPDHLLDDDGGPDAGARAPGGGP
jgi:uncharacterized membrane protein